MRRRPVTSKKILQQVWSYRLILFIASVFHGCESQEPPITPSHGYLFGRVFLHHEHSLDPLTGVDLEIGGHGTRTNDSGYFEMNSVPIGVDTLKIDHPEFGHIDTIIQVAESTRVDAEFEAYTLTGGIYRFLVPNELPRGDSLDEYFRIRKPLSADVVIDGKYRFSSSNYADCNVPTPLYWYGQRVLFSRGNHRFQITSVFAYPLDTLINFDRIGSCDSNGYNITLTPIPPLVDSEFIYPLAIGTVSNYQYYYYSNFGGVYRNVTIRVGIQEWTIASLRIEGQDSIYQCNVIEHDSVRSYVIGPDSIVSDYSFVETNTSEFQITVTRDSIRSDWPSVHPDVQLHKLPRYYPGITDSIVISSWDAHATYRSGFGLKEYRYSAGGNNQVSERLLLTEVNK